MYRVSFVELLYLSYLAYSSWIRRLDLCIVVTYLISLGFLISLGTVHRMYSRNIAQGASFVLGRSRSLVVKNSCSHLKKNSCQGLRGVISGGGRRFYASEASKQGNSFGKSGVRLNLDLLLCIVQRSNKPFCLFEAYFMDKSCSVSCRRKWRLFICTK